MDLLGVRGVGLATKERLAWAGIRTAEDLARVRDLAVVSDWTGIPSPRLAKLVEEAAAATAPRPPEVALRSAWGATARLWETVAGSISFSRRRAT